MPPYRHADAAMPACLRPYILVSSCRRAPAQGTTLSIPRRIEREEEHKSEEKEVEDDRAQSDTTITTKRRIIRVSTQE